MDPVDAHHQKASVVILNPTKVSDRVSFTRRLEAVARAAGHPVPLVLETTPEDSGTGMARQALEMDPATVVAAGGDGTVRAVAVALAGTGTPLGILPMGTGNLLARNLNLPLMDLTECARIALTEDPHPLDLGWLTIEEDEHQAFLVIGGIGFDAEMVAGADDSMKRRFGWIAYFYAALSRLFSRPMLVRVTVDGRERSTPFRARTVMVANTGRLPGGVVLAPSARPDDGWLDILALDTRAGLLGWVSLGVKVLAQRIGIRGRSDQVSTISTRRGREFRVQTHRLESVQVDGEWLGRAQGFRAHVEAGALRVRHTG